jgi:hypothetical protein
MHPFAAASWYCTICRAPKCDDCVQSTGLHAGENAACLICGGRCVKLPGASKAREDAYRAAGMLDSREARAQHLRDTRVAPLMINVLLWVQFLLGLSRNDPASALLATIAWATLAPAAMFGTTVLLNHYLETWFGIWWQHLLKLAALTLLIHVIQVAILSGLAIAFTGVFDDETLIQIMTSLVPLAIAMLIVPAVVLYVGLEYFFDLDPVELAATATALYMTYTFVFFVLAMNGVPI